MKRKCLNNGLEMRLNTKEIYFCLKEQKCNICLDKYLEVKCARMLEVRPTHTRVHQNVRNELFYYVL